MTHGGGWLTVAGVPVSQANQLLGASYQLHRPSGTNDTTILRTIGYTLPAVLHPHVETVVPTTYFASTRALRRMPKRRSDGETTDIPSGGHVTVKSSRNDDDDDDDDDEDEKEIEPSDLRSLYRTVTYVPAATNKNTLAIAGFIEDYPSRRDLKKFMKECRTDAVDATFKVVPINGGEFHPSNPSAEVNQNIQYAGAIAYPTPHIFYSVGGVASAIPGSNLPAPDDAFQAWLKYVIDQEEPVPQTISTSYGDYEKDVPLEYAKALCDLYGQLGARGVSILVTSGNNGVGDGDCIVDKETGKVQFIPEWPASCMWSI